jgi:hypothetical protein
MPTLQEIAMDCCGFSFQTGHNPATHAGAYALDRAYPAKLQPDLVERYFQASRVWHQFLGITEEGPIVVDIGSDVNQPSSEATLCAPSVPPHQVDGLFTRTNVSSEDDTVLQDDTSVVRENEQSRKWKHSEEGSMSPIQRKINTLRADLAKLEQEHKMQKPCKAASRGSLTQGNSRDQSPVPQYRKRGSQVSLSNCTDILCFLEDYGIFICKQHHTAFVNLDKHLLQYHNVLASTRPEDRSLTASVASNR